MNLNPLVNWPLSLPPLQVRAKPDGLWTCAYEYVQGPALIKIEVPQGAGGVQHWNYSPTNKCSADGDPGSSLAPTSCIFHQASPGALIGKVGGSTAGITDGKVFLVGSFAIVEIDGATRGPLFLTINDDPSGFSNNGGSLTVQISVSPKTGDPPAPQPPTPPPVVEPAKPNVKT